MPKQIVKERTWADLSWKSMVRGLSAQGSMFVERQRFLGEADFCCSLPLKMPVHLLSQLRRAIPIRRCFSRFRMNSCVHMLDDACTAYFT